MKVHISGLGVIEADVAVIRQLKNMALHSSEDCMRKAEYYRKKGCKYTSNYWARMFDMYTDMGDSIKEVLK